MTILARSDLIDLSGYRRPASVIPWLRQNGFVFVVGADGWPRVDQEHYLSRMGKVSSKTLIPSKPNSAALLEVQRNGKKANHTTRSS